MIIEYAIFNFTQLSATVVVYTPLRVDAGIGSRERGSHRDAPRVVHLLAACIRGDGKLPTPVNFIV